MYINYVYRGGWGGGGCSAILEIGCGFFGLRIFQANFLRG